MDLGPFEILCGIAALLLILHYLFVPSSNYWKKRGVRGPKPVPIFGTLKDVILLKCSMGEHLQQIYNNYPNEPVVGLFSRSTPILLIRDPDLIKDIFIKDFSTFSSRNKKVLEKGDPLSQNLVNLETARWRPLRTKLSPVFTSGKIKEMFYILEECGDHLNSYLKKLTTKNEPIEVHELTAKFTTDVIGSCVFGLKMNAIADENSEFRKMGRKIFHINWWVIFKFRIRESIPWLYDLLEPVFHDSDMTNFFVKCIKQTIEYREKNNIKRHDFVDLLHDMKKHSDKVGDIEMSDTFMAAQAFVFFVAGFETSSTAMSNTLYELAQNHAIQDKLRKEIVDELKKYDGVLKYESIKSMKYLHKVFQESLRKYPPAPHISRKSSAPYTFAGTKTTIPKDQGIIVSIYGIHRDPNFYPNPDVFDPERFDEENVKKRHPMHFLAFGDGPRNCIGARFAINQSKVGLIKILQNYKVDVCDKTEIPYAYKPTTGLFIPKNGIYLNFSKIEKL